MAGLLTLPAYSAENTGISPIESDTNAASPGSTSITPPPTARTTEAASGAGQMRGETIQEPPAATSSAGLPSQPPAPSITETGLTDDMAKMVAQDPSIGNVVYSGKFGPLSAAQKADTCHANDAGKQLLGQQAAEMFGE